MSRLIVIVLARGLLCGAPLTGQNASVERTLNITVQVLDGRSGEPFPNQRILAFTGSSSTAVKSHAEHAELRTDTSGVVTLAINPGKTQQLQVFADGRVLCFPDPNQISFSVSEIMSKGLATPNNCGALVPEPRPGHFIVFARPASFKEKMKR